ncbi:MAG: catalase [Polyangiaceae bacterium]
MTTSTDWKEDVAADEDERFERLAQRLAAVQKARGGKTRALHGKSLGGLRATFRVLSDLPEHARQGLFARPGEHRAYVRFSNGSGPSQPDKAPDFRGLAVKVLDVDGPKVLGDARTQDFLMIDTPTVPFRTPDEFIGFVCASSPPDGGIGKVFSELGFLRTLGVLAALLGAAKGRLRNVVDRTFYTPAAICFGPHAARYAAFPVHAPVDEGGPGPGRDYLAERTRDRVAKLPLEYELRAQFYSGPETPIEDSRVAWPTPFVPVARLRIEHQDTASPAGKRLHDFVEALSFDPWHALVEHRPIGAVMRARKHAYFASIQVRGAAKEPDGTEWSSFD